MTVLFGMRKRLAELGRNGARFGALLTTGSKSKSIHSSSSGSSSKVRGMFQLKNPALNPMVAWMMPKGLSTMKAATHKIAVPIPTKYSMGMIYLHWLIAAGMLTCIGTVKLSQWTPKDDPKKFGMTKGELMNIHKSTALIVAALVIPRVALRLVTKAPPLPEGNFLEHAGAKISHFAFYALMIFMPGSGIAMGYFGGKGLPFFGYKIPGATEKNGEIAKQAFKNHKLAGQALTYLVPVHVGAVGFHFVKGQNVLARMLP